MTSETDLLDRARLWATAAHAGQKYGDRPYIYHPRFVAALAAEYGMDEAVQAAAWLHDTIEDTGASYHDLWEEFGEDVADLVYAVTDERGRTRRERASRTLPKTREAGPRAVGLKLVDRLANVLNAGSRHMRMYRHEYEFFRSQLHRDGEHTNLWEELDQRLRSEE